jgi:hypothetical protein
MNIPEDVRVWIRGVFAACNVRVSTMLADMPTTHEATLDAAFIAKAAEFAAPIRFTSEWVVRIDTHFLGGRRHFQNWEIADIGILIHFRRGGQLVRTKVALLQSKRLYAQEEDYEEEDRVDYEIGFARLFRGSSSMEAILAPRMFGFGDDSRYQAIKVLDRQYRLVEEYEAQYMIPVHYLLYHPPRIPFATEIPRIAAASVAPVIEIGSRVIPAADLRAALSSKPENYVPRYADLKALQPKPPAPTPTLPGWLVEEFIADLAVDCKVGYIAEKESDKGLYRIFNRRSGPIAAAIAITFDAPGQSHA